MLLLALRKLSTWHVLPVALGLHGLFFMMPVPSSEPVAEKPKSDSVNVVTLPKPTPQKSVQPQPKVKSTPSIKPSPIVQKITPTIVTPQPSPIARQSPIATPSPSVTPSIIPSPSITPSPSDALQIEGAQPGCNGRIGCWQMGETKGRLVAGTLEQQLQKQGYELRKIELDDDTGMQVYEVTKDGARQYFLHLIWSDRGTVYVRNPELLNRGQLEAQIGT